MSDYRAEVVGSMLRPSYLREAQRLHKAGEVSHAELKRVEDRAVDECVAVQERAGVEVLTDGEMRRSTFGSQLAQSSDGFERLAGNSVDWYDLDGNVKTVPLGISCVGKIRRRRHLSSEEFVYLRGKTSRPIKVTIPSPTLYAYYWLPGVSDSAYASTDAYLEDVADILKDEVAELVRLGAEYIQFDAPEYGALVARNRRDWFAAKGFEPDRLIQQGVEMMNGIISAYPSITFGLHICRGNNESMYGAIGGYEQVAGQVFPHTRAQRLLLEYDDERSGGFGPLDQVQEGATVVLGLITTKSPRMETLDGLRGRIREAGAHVPLERLAISTQCGFASVASGNVISFEAQEAKLRLVSEAAEEVWGI